MIDWLSLTVEEYLTKRDHEHDQADEYDSCSSEPLFSSNSSSTPSPRPSHLLDHSSLSSSSEATEEPCCLPQKVEQASMHLIESTALLIRQTSRDESSAMRRIDSVCQRSPLSDHTSLMHDLASITAPETLQPPEQEPHPISPPALTPHLNVPPVRFELSRMLREEFIVSQVRFNLKLERRKMSKLDSIFTVEKVWKYREVRSMISSDQSAQAQRAEINRLVISVQTLRRVSVAVFLWNQIRNSAVVIQRFYRMRRIKINSGSALKSLVRCVISMGRYSRVLSRISKEDEFPELDCENLCDWGFRSATTRKLFNKARINMTRHFKNTIYRYY